MATNPHTILLKGRDEDRRQGVCNGAVEPGDVLHQTGSVDSGIDIDPDMQPVDTDAGPAQPAVAMEYQKTGRGIDENYSDGDDLEYRVFLPGDVFYGWVFDGANAGATGTDLSANANLSVGDYVVTYSGAGNATGAVRAYDPGNGDTAGAVFAKVVKNAVDNSGGSSKARVELEVI